MKIALFYNPQSFDAPPQGTRANIPKVLYISRNYNHSSTFSHWQFVSIFIQFFVVGAAISHKTFLFLKGGRFRLSRASKVTANRKRVCDFLLVRNSNFGPCAVLVIWQVLCAPDPTPIQPYFWGCSRCTRSPILGVNEHMDPKLFGREIIFEEFQRMWSRYLIVTDRQTDGQTTYCRITALCASIAR